MTNRMNRALETWEETKGIISNEFWYAAANRMYYACYYMTTALLIKQGYSASTHSEVIRLFGQYFAQASFHAKWGVYIAKCMNCVSPVIMMTG
ncbi:MAG: HEPN domain-containing protein [Bacteroides sp.]|nr:HEPN domain-containing protein [Bacteroides sp.]